MVALRSAIHAFSLECRVFIVLDDTIPRLYRCNKVSPRKHLRPLTRITLPHPLMETYDAPSAPLMESYGAPSAPLMETYGAPSAPLMETYDFNPPPLTATRPRSWQFQDHGDPVAVVMDVTSHHYPRRVGFWLNSGGVNWIFQLLGCDRGKRRLGKTFDVVFSYVYCTRAALAFREQHTNYEATNQTTDRLKTCLPDACREYQISSIFFPLHQIFLSFLHIIHP